MNSDIVKTVLPILLKGTGLTIQLTIYSVLIGTVLGILITLCRISKSKILSSIAFFYAWVLRGTPLMLQIMVVYYGSYFIGIDINAMGAAIISLSLNSGAYMSEIIRGGILAVDKGQFEASKALGFTYLTTMRKIVLPQTIRVIIPSVGNEFITMLKDTSLVSAIALEELAKSASLQVSSTANLTPYVLAAILYLAMTTLFTALFSMAEKKLSVY